GLPRDRSRMIGRANSGLSGPPDTYDAIKYGAASGAFTRTTLVQGPFDVRFNHDGRLAVINLNKVIDSNDSLFGFATLPVADQPKWVTVAAQIKGDGSRVYLLAYPNSGNQDSSASGIKPRIYVLNSSTASPTAGALPVLGYFEIDDYASSCIANNGICWLGLASAMTPDDATLFYSGGLDRLVVPIRAEGTLTPASISVRPAARWNLPPTQ